MTARWLLHFSIKRPDGVSGGCQAASTQADRALSSVAGEASDWAIACVRWQIGPVREENFRSADSRSTRRRAIETDRPSGGHPERHNRRQASEADQTRWKHSSKSATKSNSPISLMHPSSIQHLEIYDYIAKELLVNMSKVKVIHVDYLCNLRNEVVNVTIRSLPKLCKLHCEINCSKGTPGAVPCWACEADLAICNDQRNNFENKDWLTSLQIHQT